MMTPNPSTNLHDGYSTVLLLCFQPYYISDWVLVEKHDHITSGFSRRRGCKNYIVVVAIVNGIGANVEAVGIGHADVLN